MQTGFEAVQNAIAESENRQGRTGGAGLQYFNWKSGDTKILRFLTDAVITADFYEFVMTKDGKPKSFMVDPAKGDPLPRYVRGIIGKRKDFKSQQYVDAKPRSMTVGLAVLREERPGPDGKMEIVDALREIEVDGKKYPARVFGIVQQSPSNFWPQVVAAFRRYGTICDRDFEIGRQGDKLDTKYTAMPLEPLPGLRSHDEVQGFYGFGKEFDKEDPDRYLYCPQTLAQWADHFSSEDRYKFWLTPDEKTPPELLREPGGQFSAPAPSGSPWETTPAAQPVAPSSDPWSSTPEEPTASPASFDNVRDQLLARHKK